MPYPVDEVTGAGVEWLLLSSYFADEVFTAYRDAGVNVLMWGASRHADRQRVADLGIRGGYSLDPVYYLRTRWFRGRCVCRGGCVGR